MGETSKGSDFFISNILLGVTRVSVLSVRNSVDLFVHFSSVVITKLTGSGNCEGNSGWVPSSNTSDFSKTSMGFLLKVSNTESLDNSSNSLTLGNSEDIDHLILIENSIDLYFLFEKFVCEIDFLGDGSSVNLNFNDVIFLLSEVKFIHLGVGNNSNYGTIFFNSV